MSKRVIHILIFAACVSVIETDVKAASRNGTYKTTCFACVEYKNPFVTPKHQMLGCICRALNNIEMRTELD